MLTLSVKTSAAQVRDRLYFIRDKHIPEALAKALTFTAEDVQEELTKTIPRVFDRPTPWARNSVYKRPATVQNLVAKVALKDDAGKGVSAQKYLAAQVFGGQRRQKRAESALTLRGYLGSGETISPGGRAEIDMYGNQANSEIVQVLSALKAFSETGFRANRTAKSVKRLGPAARQFFFSRGGRLRRGVWERINQGGQRRLQPIAIVGRATNYPRRFDFFGISAAQVAANFAPNFARVALKTLPAAR